MTLTLVYIVAFAMMATGVAFIALIIRRNRRFLPKDAVEGAGMVLSLMLVGASALLVAVAATPVAEPDDPIDADGYPQLKRSELNAPAPTFSFTTVDDGEQKALTDYAGQVVLVNFWATWCAPCLTELPDLNILQDRYGGDGLVVINISDEAPEELKAFEEQLPLRTISGYIASAEALPEPYRRTIRIRPTSYVIDREGVIRHYVLGARTFAAFEEMVQPYLADGAFAGS